jgi:predicted Zn-dependent protease
VSEIERLRAALVAEPESRARRFALVGALLARGEAREAAGLLDADSTDRDERTWLAAALRAMDRGRRAERILLEVLAADPLHVAALRLLGGILIDRGRPSDALAPLSRLLRLAPADVGGRMLLARAHRHLGQLDLARRTLDDAVTVDPYDPSLHAELARWWETAGSWEEAFEQWNVAAELAAHPDPEIERRRAEAAVRVSDPSR